MVHIKTLRLQNFQTHSDTTFEFSSNFNCIVGATRSGKSSVIRALDFLFYNEWLEDFQRFFTPKTTITATLSNDVTIIRTKSKKENKLVIQTPTEKKEFEGFGVRLPREFIETISIFPVDVDSDTSIRANISNQDDPLFLIWDTGTVRTKVFSRLSGLHWIDYALKDLNKDHRNTSTELQKLKEDTVSLKKSFIEFNIEDITRQVNEAKVKFESIRTKNELIQKLENLVARTSKWKSEYQQLQQLKPFFEYIPRLEKVLNIYDNSVKRTLELRSKFSTLEISQRNLATHLQNTRDAIQSIEKSLEVELQNNPICPTCGGKVDYETFVKTGC